MELLRNKNYREKIILDSIVVLVSLMINHLYDLSAAYLILVTGLVMLASDFYYLRKQAQQINRISEAVNRLLHGLKGSIIQTIDDCEEGELAILANEIKKLATRLQEQAELLQKDKIMLSDAIADISHQLRTPLTTLNLNTDLIRDESLDFRRRIMIARDCKKQLERIHWLIETLLKLSKIDARTVCFDKNSISCSTLFQAALDPFKILMELKDIKVCERIDEDASFIGDFTWSLEAISNLIKNCMEHTPQGGKISLSTSENAIYTELIIEDNGEGFWPQDIPHLFERFYKGQNASENSIGIGLALSRSIILEENGTILAENVSDGHGARFVIRFYKMIV